MSSTLQAACYLCGGEQFFLRKGLVRDAPGVPIYECKHCGLVSVPVADKRDSAFYAESGMHANSDSSFAEISALAERDDRRRFESFQTKIVGRDVLDVGCGTAGFLALVRAAGGRAEGVEPESRLHPCFSERGLKVWNEISHIPQDQTFDLVTLFHVVEHLPDPIAILKELSRRIRIGGELIIETPSSRDALLSLYECTAFENFTYWTCHLHLFDEPTLKLLAAQSGYKVNYVKQIQRYPLANHLHWLSKGEPSGHIAWSHLVNEHLDHEYEAALAKVGACDTMTVSLSPA